MEFSKASKIKITSGKGVIAFAIGLFQVFLLSTSVPADTTESGISEPDTFMLTRIIAVGALDLWPRLIKFTNVETKETVSLRIHLNSEPDISFSRVPAGRYYLSAIHMLLAIAGASATAEHPPIAIARTQIRSVGTNRRMTANDRNSGAFPDKPRAIAKVPTDKASDDCAC